MKEGVCWEMIVFWFFGIFFIESDHGGKSKIRKAELLCRIGLPSSCTLRQLTRRVKQWAILKLSRNGYSSLYVVLLAKLLLPKLLLVKGSVCPIARVSRVDAYLYPNGFETLERADPRLANH